MRLQIPIVISLTILILVFGFVFLTGGAKLLCDSAISLANIFNINAAITGIFLVSIGTAGPDCMSALTAIIEKHSDLSIGNILGSNFANLTLGLGIASLIAPFKCTKSISKIELPLMFALTAFFVFCCFDGKLTQLEGISFLVIFAIYVTYILSKKSLKTKSLDEEETKAATILWSLKKSITVFVVSALLLALGAHFVVTSCSKIADWLGVSQTFIGFSLLAFGTSAPEIFVVTTAARRKHHSICSGNIIGSNLINLMFVTGICSIVKPVFFRKDLFITEAISLLIVTSATWYVFAREKIFSRTCGALFLSAYVIVMFLVKK